MASEMLFDVDAIDRDAVFYDADTVGSMNPQCGDMRHLDHVIWTDDAHSLMLGVKHVRDDEFWAPGHIPGRPLMPGVIMIEASAQLSSILYKLKTGDDRFLGFTRCNDASFRGQIVPGDTLYLLSKEKHFTKRRFTTWNQGVVNGKLVYEVMITGMAI